MTLERNAVSYGLTLALLGLVLIQADTVYGIGLEETPDESIATSDFGLSGSSFTIHDDDDPSSTHGSEHEQKFTVARELPNATQGPLWPPSDIVDEHGNYVLVGRALTRLSRGTIAALPTDGVLVSRHTVPPLDAAGKEDFSNLLGAPYRIIRRLDLRPDSRDSKMVLYANSYGPPLGDFGGSGRIPSEEDGRYNLNSLGITCPDLFPTDSQKNVFKRERFPLHLVSVNSFRGDGVEYHVDTGQPFVPMLRSGSECFPSGCPGEDPTSFRDPTPITLGRWLAADGSVKIKLRDFDRRQNAFTRARFEFKLRNLLPNSIYTFWAIRANSVKGQLPDPIAIPNMQRSDEHGRLDVAYTEENPFPDRHGPDGGNHIIAVAVNYNADFQNWAACTSKLGPGVDTMTVFNTAADGSEELTSFVTKAPTQETIVRARREEAERVRQGVLPFPPEEDEFFAVRPGDGPSRIFQLTGASQGAIYPPAVILDEHGNFPVVGFVPTEIAPGVIVPNPTAALVSRDTIPPLDANGREDYTNVFGAPMVVVHPLDLSIGSPDLDIELWNGSHGPVMGDFGGGIRLQKPGDSLFNLNQAIPGGEEACREQFPSSTQRFGFWTRDRYPFTEIPIHGFQGDQMATDPNTGRRYVKAEPRVDNRPRFEPVTLGDYLAVKGDKFLKITLTRFDPRVNAYTAARFDIRFRGHVPNNVYHVSLLRRQLVDPRPFRGNPTSLTVANAFSTDENGTAYLSAEMPNPFPDPAVDDAAIRVIGLVGAHHQDYLNKGGCPGIWGSAVDSGTYFNTLFQFGLPTAENPFGLVDFITQPAPPNTPGFIAPPSPTMFGG